MKYYKLIDPFDVPVSLYLPHTSKTGVKYEIIQLKPGKKYEEFVDDPVFLQELLSASKDIPYSDERKAALEAYGAKFEERRCKPCGGRIKKLRVWFAEVVE